MNKFLYGAAVQGIQDFILQSDKLREIVGASELVAQICTARFAELLGIDVTGEQLASALEKDGHFILHAAGNVKYIFEEREKCEAVVREFPKKVMVSAPGITISQAVVEFDDADSDAFSKAVDLLESRLRIQRNRPARSMTMGVNGIRRSRQTGLPAVVSFKNEKEKVIEYLDDATNKKRRASDTLGLCKRAFGEDIHADQVALDMDELASGDNNWIAVIHADGNGLGRIVQKVGYKPDLFKQFSEKLDKATVQSARTAFDAVKGSFRPDAKIPIRPVVLSGDDLTVICRADLALDYTATFIKAFEENTIGLFGDIEVFTSGEVRDRMTACAGIAYVKASYPYYYAYDLAESLCSAAKKDAKDNDAIRKGEELPQSCILFHKVQDSFNESLEDITRRELSPAEGISLRHGPYYLSDKKDRWTVSRLKSAAEAFQGEEGNAVKSTVRRWLTALHDESEMAAQMLQRAQMLYGGKQKALLLEATTPVAGRIPAYDMLVVNTINTQVTK